MTSDPGPDGPRSQPPADGPRSQPPTDGSWRTDGLGGSRHSRLVDSLQQPAGDSDPQRAARLCAEVTRNALQDLAPVLVLLPATDRSRAQVLLSYAVAIFDFALQTGVEGERLAALNRWEFDREMTLDGAPPEQPIFVALAAEHQRHPFPDTTFDSLASLARQVAVQPRPRSRQRANWRWRELGKALASGLIETRDPVDLDGIGDLLGAAIRLRRLQDLPADGSLIHSQIALEEWPEDRSEGPTSDQIEVLMAAERNRLRPLFTDLPAGLGSLPRSYRRAALFLSLAGRHLLARFEDRAGRERSSTPRLGLPARLTLLARSLRPS